jgi:hypothetical protein
MTVDGLAIGKHVTDGGASLRTTLMGVTDVGTAEKHEAAARPTRCGLGRRCAEQRRVTAGLVSPQVPMLLGQSPRHRSPAH